MKRLIMLSMVVASLTACTGLKELDTKHKAERKELRTEQREIKKEIAIENKAKVDIVRESNKIAMDKVKEKMNKEKELLALKQVLELSKSKENRISSLEQEIIKLEAEIK
ncbi:MAG: hypothetical protein ACRC6E_01715 [Fusobacteriaceae bacterium]